MDGRYVTKRAKTDKGRAAYIASSSKNLATARQNDARTLILDRIRKELPGVCWTLGLVAVLTAVLFALVWEMGLLTVPSFS